MYDVKGLQLCSSELLTLLSYIVRCGHLEVVKYLVEVQGVSAGCTDHWKLTPLHRACW